MKIFQVQKTVGITISIGCSSTKSIAKIASDHNKPNGVTVVKPEYIKNFLGPMDITKIPGIGKKSKIFYYRKGIKTIGDIINLTLPKMVQLFGKNGEWAWEIANGLDNHQIESNLDMRKSVSKERTFYEDTDDFNSILTKLEEINNKIHGKLEKDGIYYKTITLKIRFEGYITYTRSKSLSYPIQDEKKAMIVILELYQEFLNYEKKVRLVGIRFSNLTNDKKQLPIVKFM